MTPVKDYCSNFQATLSYLVLIQGSNLDKPLADGSINLTHAGLQRSAGAVDS